MHENSATAIPEAWCQAESTQVWNIQKKSVLPWTYGLQWWIYHDPAELAPVLALKEKTPATVGDLRRLLGFLSYYRAYISNFSKLATPLYQLLSSSQVKQSPAARGKDKRGASTRNKGNLSPNSPIEWTQCHQERLNSLIDKLTVPPILGYPDLTEPFVLQWCVQRCKVTDYFYSRYCNWVVFLCTL